MSNKLEIIIWEPEIVKAELCCNVRSPYDKTIFCDLPAGHDSFHWYRGIARWGKRERKADDEL
jgi:hypothetical protein